MLKKFYSYNWIFNVCTVYPSNMIKHGIYYISILFLNSQFLKLHLLVLSFPSYELETESEQTKIIFHITSPKEI